MLRGIAPYIIYTIENTQKTAFLQVYVQKRRRRVA